MPDILLQQDDAAILQQDGFYILLDLLNPTITSANAKFDENGRPTIILASDQDGVTIVAAMADPTTHVLETDDDASGSDNGNNSDNAMLDENSVPVWIALSSDNDGTIVEVYGDPGTNQVLINSN